MKSWKTLPGVGRWNVTGWGPEEGEILAESLFIARCAGLKKEPLYELGLSYQ